MVAGIAFSTTTDCIGLSQRNEWRFGLKKKVNYPQFSWSFWTGTNRDSLLFFLSILPRHRHLAAYATTTLSIKNEWNYLLHLWRKKKSGRVNILIRPGVRGILRYTHTHTHTLTHLHTHMHTEQISRLTPVGSEKNTQVTVTHAINYQSPTPPPSSLIHVWTRS